MKDAQAARRGVGTQGYRVALVVLASIAVAACGGGGGSASALPPGSASSVSGVSGTASHGNSLTITGSGFGSKNHAGPAIYDDFDDAASGNIAGRSVPVHQGIFSDYSTWEEGWNGISEPPNIVRDASAPKARSSYHARASFLSDAYWSRRLAIARDSFDTGDERYISFYYRFRKTAVPFGAQTKAWMVFPAGGFSDAAYWSTAFDICQGGGWRQHLSQTAEEQSSSMTGPEIDNEWVRFESYLKLSAANTPNGTWIQTTYRPTLITPGREVLIWENISMRTNSNNWDYWEFGGAFYDVCSPGDTATIDIDEFYMDSTPARVEVCNAPTFSASTQCELQVSTAWSDTSITVTFNQGYLGASPAYVYVMNSAGSVNAAGHAIMIVP